MNGELPLLKESVTEAINVECSKFKEIIKNSGGFLDKKTDKVIGGLIDQFPQKSENAVSVTKDLASSDKKVYRTWEMSSTSNQKAQKEKHSHIFIQDKEAEMNGSHLPNHDIDKEQTLSRNGSCAEIKDSYVKSPSKKLLYTELARSDAGSAYEKNKKEGTNISHIPVRVTEDRRAVHSVDSHNSQLKFESDFNKTLTSPVIKQIKPDSLHSKFVTDESNRRTDTLLSKAQDYLGLSPSSEDIEISPVKSPDSLEFSPVKEYSGQSVSCEGVDKQYSSANTEVLKEIKTLPVYVSIVQVGKQYEKEVQQGGVKKVVNQESRTVQETRGTLFTTKPQKQPPSPQGSPEDDTLEQVSFIDSSGKSPLTPETPSSEEVSYEFNSKTPDSLMPYIPGKPSPIPEVSEESEEEEVAKLPSIKQSISDTQQSNLVKPVTISMDTNKRTKDNRVAYIEFPPPPPLDSEHSDSSKKNQGNSTDSEMELTEVNLQDDQDKLLSAEPVIRVQPPSPVPPELEFSDSSDDESIMQPVAIKKYTFKIKDEDVKECTKINTSGKSSPPKQANELEMGFNSSNDLEQNGNNDQSVTECSIATTAEFSHDTDATEIDSLDGYDLQDEDDGLTESDAKLGTSCEEVEIKKEPWAKEGVLKHSDRSFSQSKLEVIEEEKVVPEEYKPCRKISDNDKKTDMGDKKQGTQLFTLEGRHPDRPVFPDTYFSYKVDEEFATPFKTVATKSLDFDPWSSKAGDDDVFETKSKDEDPKPFSLAVEDRSQATTPDTTPARTPTDESTPTSEPNPFPFHEGKMFEMTRSGAIDMSKRDFVEERLQFFQIGEHNSEGKSGEKGDGDKITAITLPQSGDMLVDPILEKQVETTTVEHATIIQGSGDCLDGTNSNNALDKTAASTNCKVDPKMRTPIKMGISASTMTAKKDGTGEVADKIEFVPDSQNLDNDSKTVLTNISTSETIISHIEIHDFQTENFNNNNNLDSFALNVNNNTINLVLSKECESKSVNNINKSVDNIGKELGTSNQKVEKDKQIIQKSDHKLADSSGNKPRSKLPIKSISVRPVTNQNSNTNMTLSRRKLPAKSEKDTRQEYISNAEGRSRIPIKNMNRVNPPIQKKATPKHKQTQIEKESTKQTPSKLPVKVRSVPSATSTAKVKKHEFSEVCKHSIEYFKGISGETLKLVDRLSDEEKKMQTELSDDEDSTSRNTSLSEATQVSQPSVTSRSAKDMKADATSLKSKIEKADSERRSSRRTGPQSPCERTDIRMAIVADHLGLSWTELARELNFSVDEINQIRVENPNSLTTQSFILLKKWVVRDGKNATTDTLTNVLTKINRIDIVTLLEGPIFDYGNISGTRSFAEDNNVFGDPTVDGWHTEASSIRVEQPTPERKLNSELMEKLDDSHESITSYLKGEVGRLGSNVSPSESLTEGKTSSHAPVTDPVKSNGKQKPKTLQGLNGKGEQTSPSTVRQKSPEMTSKAVIGEHKSSLPVSAKRTGLEEAKSRPTAHAEEGASVEKTEGYKVKTKKEVRHIEKKTYS